MEQLQTLNIYNNDIMKEKAKAAKPKALPLKTKSAAKIIIGKENIKTQEVERKRVVKE